MRARALPARFCFAVLFPLSRRPINDRWLTLGGNLLNRQWRDFARRTCRVVRDYSMVLEERARSLRQADSHSVNAVVATEQIKVMEVKLDFVRFSSPATYREA